MSREKSPARCVKSPSGKRTHSSICRNCSRLCKYAGKRRNAAARKIQ